MIFPARIIDLTSSPVNQRQRKSSSVASLCSALPVGRAFFARKTWHCFREFPMLQAMVPSGSRISAEQSDSSKSSRRAASMGGSPGSMPPLGEFKRDLVNGEAILFDHSDLIPMLGDNGHERIPCDHEIGGFMAIRPTKLVVTYAKVGIRIVDRTRKNGGPQRFRGVHDFRLAHSFS